MCSYAHDAHGPIVAETGSAESRVSSARLAYACETVATVNVAMFDATGWRAMAVSAFSAAARSADGQPSHREHH